MMLEEELSHESHGHLSLSVPETLSESEMIQKEMVCDVES